MAQPAPGRDLVINPSKVVTISSNNGVFKPSADPVTIPVGGCLQFVNNASQGVAIELFTHLNDHHPAVSIYIPPSGQGNNYVTLCNDPGHQSSRCPYNIVAYPPSNDHITDSSSGGHTIVIGSGDPD